MASSSANIWVILGLGLAGILIMTRKLKKAIRADFGAFVSRLELLPPPPPPPPKAPNPLTSLTFAVSDLFDIEGYVTGFGSPDWVQTHEIASRTAPVVLSLVEGGATCVGKTVIDEMGYSISGENKHYGTPTNPGAPGRVPGGSCSGAAVAVAADLVDFSVGVDTVGGVRLPAAFCGALGFKASHGAISHSGTLPLSLSLDTIGCFAKDPNVLRRAVHNMMQVQFGTQRNPKQIILADDCFELLKFPAPRVSQPVINATEKLFGRQVLRHENLGAYLSSKVPSLSTLSSNESNGELKASTLSRLGQVMQQILRYEFKKNHEEWMSSVKADLGIWVGLQEGRVVDDGEIEKLHTVRNEMRAALNSLLKDDGILVIPTFADPPPKVGGKELASETYLSRLGSLLSIASLSGCCQVAVPLGYYSKLPVSVSLVARHGGDRFLLDSMQAMYASLQEQGDVASIWNTTSNKMTVESSAEIAKEKGNQAFKDKQWQQAIGFYSDAIKRNANNATYYSNRAAAYLELGSFVQAEADCTKALSLDKKSSATTLAPPQSPAATLGPGGQVFHSNTLLSTQTSTHTHTHIYMECAEETVESTNLCITMNNPIDDYDDANSWSSSCDEPSDLDDYLLSQSGSITKLQPRNAVIKACWNDGLSMSEVLHHKGRLLVSLGIVRNTKIYLSIEETLFLVEIGALMLVDDKDTAKPLKDLYEIVAQGKGGCSWEHFEVYRYLKSLGFIVGRHSIPWSLKSVKCGSMSVEGSSENDGTLPIVNGTLIVESLKGLQIREMTPFFDVYLPSSKFRKTSCSDPVFTVSLARHKPPSRSDIEELEKQCNGIPLKVVHVEHGRVTFFSFNQVDLPSLP